MPNVAPVTTLSSTVTAEMLDDRGHMNYLTYQAEADRATCAFWSRCVSDRTLTFVTLETHVRYLTELRINDTFKVHCFLIALDDKRFIVSNRIERGGKLSCRVDVLAICFDPRSRRAATLPDETLVRLQEKLQPLESLLTLKRPKHQSCSDRPKNADAASPRGRK